MSEPTGAGRDVFLRQLVYKLLRCDDEHFASSERLMRDVRIPADGRMARDDEGWIVFSLAEVIDRLLLLTEGCGVQLWGSNAWDNLEDRIEEHRRDFWQERTIAQYGGPADRARERRAARKRDHRISAVLREQIHERDGYKCVQCGKTTDLTIDHITPVAQGGNEDPDNLRTLCRSCNSSNGGHLSEGATERHMRKWSDQQS